MHTYTWRDIQNAVWVNRELHVNIQTPGKQELNNTFHKPLGDVFFFLALDKQAMTLPKKAKTNKTHTHTQTHSQTTCHCLTSPTVTEEKKLERKRQKRASQMTREQLTRFFCFLMKINEHKIRSLSFSLHSWDKSWSLINLINPSIPPSLPYPLAQRQLHPSSRQQYQIQQHLHVFLWGFLIYNQTLLPFLHPYSSYDHAEPHNRFLSHYPPPHLS